MILKDLKNSDGNFSEKQKIELNKVTGECKGEIIAFYCQLQ